MRFKRNNRGFTLVEILVSLAILSGALIVVNMTWSGNLVRFRKSNLYNNVAFLLEGKVAEIHAKYDGKPLSEVVEEESGDFEGNANYRWTMKSREMDMPDLTSIIMANNEGSAPEQLLSMVRQMTEHIGKTVKEVKISVWVKSAGKSKREVEFSVTTYFVDFKTPLPLPGIPQ